MTKFVIECVKISEGIPVSEREFEVSVRTCQEEALAVDARAETWAELMSVAVTWALGGADGCSSYRVYVTAPGPQPLSCMCVSAGSGTRERVIWRAISVVQEPRNTVSGLVGCSCLLVRMETR